MNNLSEKLDDRSAADTASGTDSGHPCVANQGSPAASDSLAIGRILSAVDGRTAPFEGKARILGVSDDRCEIAMIRVDVPTPVAPFICSVDQISACLRQEDLVEDVFDALVATSESQLTVRAREAINSNFKAIEPLLRDINRILFDPDHRRQEVKRIAEETKKNERTIMRSLLMYWFMGNSKLGMAGPLEGEQSEPKVQARNTKRRGRPPRRGEPSQPLWKVRDKGIKGIMEFIGNQKFDDDKAYDETLNNYFSHGKKGVWLKPELLISRKQFRYLSSLLRKKGIIPGKRHPRRGAGPGDRVQGSMSARGPGDRFEIDATKLQIRIVSSLDRTELVREVTLYIVVDVWSCGTIVGYAISLGPASMEVAREAFLNCATDKSQVFRRLNIDLPDSPWLICTQLPNRCGVDRGELISKNAGVIPDIGIILEIAPPYMPELKAQVEQTFNRIKHGRATKKIPGSHSKLRTRGEDDGKKDAFLTQADLERLIVLKIQKLNAQPVPRDKIPFQALREGITNISRIALYAWGLKRLPGFTREVPFEKVFIELMAHATASMTAKGLLYQTEVYYSPKLEELGYVERWRDSKDGFKVEIRYPRHDPDQIWFLDKESNRWHPALNTDPEVIARRCTHRELEAFRRRAEAAVLETRRQSGNLDSVIDPMIEATVQSARALTNAAKSRGKKRGNHINEMTSIEHNAERVARDNRDLALFSPEPRMEYEGEPGDEQSVEEWARMKALNAAAAATWLPNEEE